MVFIEFFILAVIVVLGSNKLAKQADVIEQNSKINAAFIGIILAFATSLPELATGLTSAYIGQPTMALSNILGSNIFNTTIVAVVNIYFFKELIYLNVKKETNTINYFVVLMYISLIISLFLSGSGILFIGFINLSSIIFIILYLFSLKFIHEEEALEIEEQVHDKKKLKSSVYKFIFFAAVILISSMMLSVVAEDLMVKTGLDASFVGAIFIGVTTSLPEFTSLITLVKLKQYDLGVSSVLGSNLFNFLILSVVDIIARPEIYKIETGILPLAFIGLTTVLLTIIAIKSNIKKWYYNIIIPIIIILIYTVYIVTGV